jgi:hypothetical protein
MTTCTKRIAMPKKIDPHALVALIRRELKLPDPDAGLTFPTPFGEPPDALGGPDLDDDPWPIRYGRGFEEE